MIDDAAHDPLRSKYDPLADCPDLLAELGWTPSHVAPGARRPLWFRRRAARFTDGRAVIELPSPPATAATSRFLHPVPTAR
jgi:hypothetical protein